MFSFVITSMWVISCVISMINSETIHFTNSQDHLNRSKNFTTYELKVPGGSEPITIIETNGEEPIRIEKSSVYRRKTVSSSSPSTTSKPQYHSNLLFVDNNKNSSAAVPKRMVYAPSLLNKFMSEYNSKIHDTIQSDRIEIDRADLQDYHHHIEDERRGDGEHYSKWNNQMWTTGGSQGSQRKPSGHPFTDKEGWVTMEAVPWSRSQVSKWKPNVSSFTVYRKGHLPSGGPGSGPGPNTHDDDRRYSHRPPSGYYGNPNDDEFYESMSPSPSPPLPHRPPHRYYADDKKSTNHYGDDVKLETSSSMHDRWYDYNYHRPTFDEYTTKPWHDAPLENNGYHSSSTKRRPSSVNNYLDSQPAPLSDKRVSLMSSHPSTYPSRGNGEWILVSTTKGYQYPVHRVQRGMSLPPTETSEPVRDEKKNLTFTAHRSIKLTVLPAKNDPNSKTTRKLMTTSHGGLLEVESSLQTVEGDASTSMSSRNRTRKATAVDSLIDRKKDKTKNFSNRVYRAVPITTSKDPSPDSSAVLAAVGAGMVPATVAMLMPIVLGRKKRSLFRDDKINNSNFNPSYLMQKL